MAQFNPFKGSFEKSKLYSKYAKIALWISTVILLIAFLIRIYYSNLLYISDCITRFNCFFILAFGIFSFISDFIFYQASINRREDFIDNSFNSTIAEDRSIDYFTNENISHGIYKMAVNSFENTFYTYQIAQKMTSRLWVKNTVFIILLLIFAIFGYGNAFTLLIQLTLPILLLQQAIKHSLFVYRIKRVYENYRRLFNNLKEINDSKQKWPDILTNVLDYETTLSYGAILIDSKIYSKLNFQLSEKWNHLKEQYFIK